MEVPRPMNSLVTAMLTDLYQLTMAYAHWKNKRQDDPAVFELFFRKSSMRQKFASKAELFTQIILSLR